MALNDDQLKKLASEQDAGGIGPPASGPAKPPRATPGEPVVLHPVPVHRSAFEDLERPPAA